MEMSEDTLEGPRFDGQGFDMGDHLQGQCAVEGSVFPRLDFNGEDCERWMKVRVLSMLVESNLFHNEGRDMNTSLQP